MSSDFLNFGTMAVELAATASIVGEEAKMLRNAQKTVRERKRPMKKEHKTSRNHSRNTSKRSERFDLGISF